MMLTELHDTYDAKSRASMNDHGSFVTLTFRTEHDTITLYLPPNMLACVSMIVPAYNAHMVDDGEKSALEMAKPPTDKLNERRAIDTYVSLLGAHGNDFKGTMAAKVTDEQVAEARKAIDEFVPATATVVRPVTFMDQLFDPHHHGDFITPSADPHGLAPTARLDAALKLEDGE